MKEEYRTSDLWLASYLLTRGEKLAGIIRDRIDLGKFIFVLNGKDLEKKAKGYYENAEIPGLSFKSIVLDLKHKLYKKMKEKEYERI